VFVHKRVYCVCVGVSMSFGHDYAMSALAWLGEVYMFKLHS